MLPHAEKLDASLLLLVGGGLASEGEFPVVLTAAPNRLADVVALIGELHGRVRHRLDFLGAVSAWLSLEAVEAAAQSEAVATLEIAQANSAL